MISEDKNKNKWDSENALLPHKSKLKTKSKILVLGLILFIVLTGLFGSAEKAQAASAACGMKLPGTGSSSDKDFRRIPIQSPGSEDLARKACAADSRDFIYFEPDPPVQTKELSTFKDEIDANKCGLWTSIYPGCFIQALYGFMYVIPSFILYVAAYFFNILINITLNGSLLRMNFISEAWGAVRDLSNIFFILILLYIAIKMILDLGGSAAKSMIVKVIIVALLINFSMFFTQVVIDSSNMIALVFYNKLGTKIKDAKGSPIAYKNTGYGEKDVAGGLVSSFNPIKLITPEYLEKAKTQTITLDGGEFTTKSTKVAPGILIGMLIIAGVLMLLASYALIIAGLCFLGRLIELFILIIFSPFAFMSFTVPQILGNVDYLGWNDWSKRLLQVSFMAPIFMFFLFFISMLIKSESLFEGLKSSSNARLIESILMIALPALLISILLLKATDFAKKGAGAFGEMIMKGAKMAGGLALGVATGGTAMLGAGLVGGGLNKLSGKFGESLKTAGEEKGIKGYAAKLALKTMNYGSGASFDIRKTAAGGAFGKFSGMNLQSSKFLGLGSKEGGFKGKMERKAQALEKEKDLLKTTKTDAQVKEWSEIKQYKYDADMNEARENARKSGKVFSEDHYKQKNGERPEIYNTAEKLNNARMKAFQNNLGQSDLLGTLAYETIKRAGQLTGGRVGGLVENNEKITDKNGIQTDNKKYYKNSIEYRNWEQDKKDAKDKAKTKQGADFDEDTFDQVYDKKYKVQTAESINKTRVNTAKMAIGAAATIGTGGYAGAAIGAGLAGGALGAGLAGSYATVGAAAEAKFSAGLEKEFVKMKNIETRIDEQKKLLATQTEVLGEVAELKDASGNNLLIVKKEGTKDIYNNNLYTVDNKKLTEAFAKVAFEEQDTKSRLEALNRKIAEVGTSEALEEAKNKLKNEMIKLTIKTGQLNAIRGIDQTMANTRNRIYDLGGQKSNIQGGGAGSPTPPPTPPPPTP